MCIIVMLKYINDFVFVLCFFVFKDKEKEKRLQVGDWSEHISSSGKKYYYNCKTEVSQWEKPKEWIDWER